MAETKRLYRSCKDRILGGVAGGLGEYFEIDSTIIRLIFLLLIFSGVGVIAYLVAWIVIPIDPSCESKREATEEIRDSAEKFAQSIRSAVKDSPKSTNKMKEDTRFWLGIIIVVLGSVFIFQNIIGVNFWTNFWPLLLIAVGIVIIAKSMDNRK